MLPTRQDYSHDLLHGANSSRHALQPPARQSQAADGAFQVSGTMHLAAMRRRARCSAIAAGRAARVAALRRHARHFCVDCRLLLEVADIDIIMRAADITPRRWLQAPGTAPAYFSPLELACRAGTMIAAGRTRCALIGAAALAEGRLAMMPRARRSRAPHGCRC